MDKSWIQIHNRAEKEYTEGIEEFMKVAIRHAGGVNSIRCPCRKCGNRYYKDIKEVHFDLYNDGMDRTYTKWNQHGETNEDPMIEDDNVTMAGDKDINADTDKEVIYQLILVRSKINTENHSKLKVKHTCGTKSFVQRRYEMIYKDTREELDLMTFYRATHKSTKTGNWVTPHCEELYYNMVHLTQPALEDIVALTPDKAFYRTLGTKSSYVCGLGHGEVPKSTRCSNPDINVATRRAEQAEVVADELRTEVTVIRGTMKGMQTRQAQLEDMVVALMTWIPSSDQTTR